MFVNNICHLLAFSTRNFVLSYIKNYVCNIVYVATVAVSGFGGLEVACWPLVPKFAGSNPAEVVEFFRAKKILSTPSFGREVKPFVPCRRFTALAAGTLPQYNTTVADKVRVLNFEVMSEKSNAVGISSDGNNLQNLISNLYNY